MRDGYMHNRAYRDDAHGLLTGIAEGGREREGECTEWKRECNRREHTNHQKEQAEYGRNGEREKAFWQQLFDNGWIMNKCNIAHTGTG